MTFALEPCASELNVAGERAVCHVGEVHVVHFGEGFDTDIVDVNLLASFKIVGCGIYCYLVRLVKFAVCREVKVDRAPLTSTVIPCCNLLVDFVFAFFKCQLHTHIGVVVLLHLQRQALA